MEEAANELINMLLEFDHNQREGLDKAEEETCTESKTADHMDTEGMLKFSYCGQTEQDTIRYNGRYVKLLIRPDQAHKMCRLLPLR